MPPQACSTTWWEYGEITSPSLLRSHVTSDMYHHLVGLRWNDDDDNDVDDDDNDDDDDGYVLSVS